MAANNKLELGTLEETLNRVPFALTLSDLSAPDHPLVYTNTAFRELSGYGDEVIGQNCRFLQGDHPNTDAREEIKLALSESRRTQVLLKNVRKNGEDFRNLLMLEPTAQFENFPQLALGTQFDVGAEDPDLVSEIDNSSEDYMVSMAKSTALRIKLERRRIASDSAVRFLQSWCILNGLVAVDPTRKV